MERIPHLGKHDKMRDDIRLMELHAHKASQEARKRFIKTQKNAVYDTNLIRLMRVAQLIYCEEDLIAILLCATPQPVLEYDCDPDVDPDELTGRYFNRRELFQKHPDLIPAVRHISSAYEHLLPQHKVLKPCPKGCPDSVWRAWAEIRWARYVVRQK